MEYTIVNCSNEKLILQYYPIPYESNRTDSIIDDHKKKIKDYFIFPLDSCKVAFSTNEDTFFKIMGHDSFIEFEFLKVDKKIHVTHTSNISCRLNSTQNTIYIGIISHK